MTQEELYKKYPALFAQTKLSKQQSCMFWGIECNEGWYPLIDELSQNLSNYIGVEYAQIKEKFGTLRIYLNYHDDVTPEIIELCDGYVDDVSCRSATICEICGEPGKIHNNGWLQVRCNKHKPSKTAH